MSAIGPTKIKDLPLLPYERQLAEALGITEAEYRGYRKDLVNYAKPRPAEYDHIPDVRNDVVSVVVSLVIGAVLTAVSAALAPKPKAAQSREQEKRTLGSESGRTRFNATQNFSGIQEVASLGAVIPITFGRYDQITGTGGIVVQPNLVWSRMFSYGSHQGFKGMYVIGENLGDRAVNTLGQDDPSRPNPAGIYIGGLPLESLPPEQFALYWNTNYAAPYGRIRNKDLVAGTRAYPAAGDPQEGFDVYRCPIEKDVEGRGFCMASIPSGDTTFGIFQPIQNGNGWRLNWRIVPFPTLPDQSDDPEDRILMERRKIAGTYGDNQDEGMRGIGRAYSPRMGIYAVNGIPYNTKQERVRVDPGDECTFLIKTDQIESPEEIGINRRSELKANDVNSSLNSNREYADEVLQVGERIQIGTTLWQITHRTNQVWRIGGPDIHVTLRMIENMGAAHTNTIDVAGLSSINKKVQFEGDYYGTGTDYDHHIGQSWNNVSKTATAVVRNTRMTEVTEIGIRSEVWNRADGLCNFGNLPTPQQLKDYEMSEPVGATIQSGTITKYFTRTSVFMLQVRSVEVRADGTLPPYETLRNVFFCITGSKPVSQYNFIRIRPHSGIAQLEFRFIPRPGGDLRDYAPQEGEAWWRLDPRTYTLLSSDFYAGSELFQITTVGEVIPWPISEQIYRNEELTTEGEPQRTIIRSEPTGVVVADYIPQGKDGNQQVFECQILGDSNGYAYGTRRSGTFTCTIGDKSITIRLTATVGQSNGQAYFYRFGTKSSWGYENYEVVSYVGDWNMGEQCQMEIDTSGYYAGKIGVTVTGIVMRISNANTWTEVREDSGRVFEDRSQINELSYYDQIAKSCDNTPEHELLYINETITPNTESSYPFTTMGLAMRSSNQVGTIEQLQVWMPDGIRCKRLAEGADVYGPSNLFSDLAYYLLTDDVAGIGATQSGTYQWIDEEGFRLTSEYLKANNIFFDGAIASRQNIRNYLIQMAQLCLCNLTIKNGRFSMSPAVPYDENTKVMTANAPAPVALFSSGNIVAGTLNFEFLDAAERQNFRAIMNYRTGEKFKSFQTDNVLVRWNEEGESYYPMEDFDLSEFCTNQAQAEMTARYLLSLRRRVDHAVVFKTLPLGLSLAPGEYIKLITTSAPITSYSIGVINPENGQIVSAQPLGNGVHSLIVYVTEEQYPVTREVVVEDGYVADKSFWGSLFSTSTPTETKALYLVEQLELGDDGLVEVTASHHPVNDQGQSLIALDVLDPSGDRFLYRD